MRISDWSSDVCSSDLHYHARACCGLYPGDHAGPGARRADDTRQGRREGSLGDPQVEGTLSTLARQSDREALGLYRWRLRSEEHTSELQSLMRISYAVFCSNIKITSFSITYHPQ